ncbi:unnamed protein product [Protopolystoma xenopodis]|uniref:Uncharacterized protein n=1 Tax=Protopolystoma xenopodis TaxID=117903 RepID=A0A448WGX3_9PLAT|nr:unnamed protein product [Protopolystoma xenopodis]
MTISPEFGNVGPFSSIRDLPVGSAVPCTMRSECGCQTKVTIEPGWYASALKRDVCAIVSDRRVYKGLGPSGLDKATGQPHSSQDPTEDGGLRVISSHNRPLGNTRGPLTYTSKHLHTHSIPKTAAHLHTHKFTCIHLESYSIVPQKLTRIDAYTICNLDTKTAAHPLTPKFTRIHTYTLRHLHAYSFNTKLHKPNYLQVHTHRRVNTYSLSYLDPEVVLYSPPSTYIYTCTHTDTKTSQHHLPSGSHA